MGCPLVQKKPGDLHVNMASVLREPSRIGGKKNTRGTDTRTRTHTHAHAHTHTSTHTQAHTQNKAIVYSGRGERESE